VCSGKALIGLNSCHRAFLLLRPPPPPLRLPSTRAHAALHRRCRDVARALRNQPRTAADKNLLSLRVNTDFDAALRLLRQHHATSWVTFELEAAWRLMFDRMQLVIFELWCGDTMIAADVGHPYV
jgi:hypothetical protein